MSMEKREFEKEKEAIKAQIHKLFHSQMDIFTWDVPENNETRSAALIIEAMQEALNELKKERQV
jgi:hypothetical protein